MDGEEVKGTKMQQLLKIIWETKPKAQLRPMPPLQPHSPTRTRSAASNWLQHQLRVRVDCDEVYPDIYIGDEGSARDRELLASLGVTHVLNAAEGKGFGMVSTNEKYYAGTRIRYMGLKLEDLPHISISNHFEAGAEFIESALSNGGKILVHCVMGMSRSATIVLAYLMIKKGLSAETALRSVRQCRDIRPNDGFLRQLCELDYKLHRRASM